MTNENNNEIVEIIDERTGEIIPRGIAKVDKFATSNLQIQVNANTIGTLELSEEALRVLDEPIDPNDVQIRPDGLVYFPWTYWARRLNDAFGRLQWGLIPQGAPQSKQIDNNTILVVWGFWLIVKGVPISFAMGETSYRTNNNTMSYADAVEGARSISLARNCKHLGISLELFDPEWIEEWKEKYARKIKNPRGNYPEYIWVRNDDKRYFKESQKTASKPPVKPANPAKNEQFPTTEELAGAIPYKDLRKADNIEAIKAGSNKTIPEIMAFINRLHKDGLYTLKELIEFIKQEQQDE